jgi:large subunit ribosomal protein L9
VQVILLEDVKALGKKGSVVKVTDGYAKNFLFPKKLALEATEGNVRNQQHKAEVASTKHAREVEAARESGRVLQAARVEVRAHAGDKGKLYGAVTNHDVADVIGKILGEAFDKRKIVLKDPIKTLGTFAVKVKLHTEVSVNIDIHVVASPESTEAAASR